METYLMGPIGRSAGRACLWEVTARKPGNVHRFADFDDLKYLDFSLSAVAVAPVLDLAPSRPVGETILTCVESTRRVIATNTNLGIILSLAPLAAVPEGEDLRTGVESVLAGLSVEDARNAYRAIRLAEPGGLGRVETADVRDEPAITLREAMRLAADRDAIARQYADGFEDVFTLGLSALVDGFVRYGRLELAIIHCHLTWLSRFPDSLIVRKHGSEAAATVRSVAPELLNGSPLDTPAGAADLAAFDARLRQSRPRLNPGTTADLVAASLFVALRSGSLPESAAW